MFRIENEHELNPNGNNEKKIRKRQKYEKKNSKRKNEQNLMIIYTITSESINLNGISFVLTSRQWNRLGTCMICHSRTVHS